MDSPAIAYLVSEYPAISHTFVFREVQSLRSQGLTVKTASVRRPELLDRMTVAEKADAAETLYIKSLGVGGILGAHFRLLRRSPGQYFQMVKAVVKPNWEGHVPLSKLAAYFAGAGVLVDWMTRQGIGHVHVHLANPAATVAMIAAASGLVTFSMSVHGPDVFYNVDGNLLKEKAESAQFVRCISHFCRSQIMRLLPFPLWNRLHIVRCGVDVSAFAPRPEPNNDVPELVCVGRLVPAKGQHILLEACAALRERNRPFHLTFVGDGPDRVSLESACAELGLSDAVTFAGAVGQDKVHGYYDTADVFVLASFAEGLPVVLMEAMAKTIPCVATRIVAIPELIEDGVNGLLVTPSDIDGLADALERLLADPALRRTLGERGRETVLAHYDIEGSGLGMGELFRAIGRDTAGH